MAEKPTDYRRYAGRVLFPRTPDDLTDRDRCPACHTALTQSVCTSCGLDVRHPLAAELLAESRNAAEALDRRLDLIGHIRYDTEQAAIAASRAEVDAMIAQRTAPTVPAQPVAQALAPSQSQALPQAQSQALPQALALPPAGALPPVPPLPSAPPAQASPHVPKRSGIQVLLVVVGISLLSIAAIFFLVYAFITWGLLARSIIIGAITVGAIVGAVALRRRRLPATAEGVSIFAVVLLYLDAFAVRGNDLLGAAAADPAVYWGWTLIITAVGFVAWSRFSGLRSPAIAAFATFAPGVAFVVTPASSTDPTVTGFVFAATIALVAGIHRAAATLLGRPARIERLIALIWSVAGLAIAGLFALLIAPEFRWGATIALLVVTVLAAVQVVLADYRAAPDRNTPVVGAISAAIGAIALTSALPAGLYRTGDTTLIVVLPVLIGTVIALLLEALTRLTRGTGAAVHSITATIASMVTAALFGSVPFAILLVTALGPPAAGLGRSWRLSPTEATPLFSHLDVTSLATVTGAVVLVAGAWWFGGVIRRRVGVLVWAACAIVVLAVPTLHTLWLVLTGWEAVAFAAVIAVTVTDVRGRLAPAVRAALLSTAFTASALAWATSWASMDTWQLVSLAVILVLLASRLFFTGAARSTLLAIAVSLFVIMGAAGARDLAMPLHPTANADLVNVFRATGFVGILLLGLVSLLRVPAIRALDRRVVFWIAAAVIAISTAVSQTALLLATPRDLAGRLLPEYATAAVVSVFLGAALLCWTMARAPRRFPLERAIAVGALPLTLYWFVDSLVRALGADDSLIALAPATAAVIAAAASLAIVGTRLAHTLPRTALDAGVVIVGVAGFLAPALVDVESTWLALLISSVTVLLLANGREGLLASRSPRRHLGWLALGLASAGLWQGLVQADVHAIEPYVLPVAGALLLIAAVSALFSPAAPSLRNTGITLGGLLLAIVPESIAATSGPIARPIVVGALCAILLVGASVVRGRGTAQVKNSVQRYLDSAAVAAAVGVIIVTIARASAVLLDASQSGSPRTDARLEAWLAPGLVVLILAAVGQARARAESSPARGIVAQATLAFAMIAAVAFELTVLYPDAAGFARAATLTALLCAALVASIALRRTPLTVPVGWLGFALAAVVSVTALGSGAFGELELVTVPLAAALIVAGGIRLRRASTTRTWSTLAPGVALLLVPSLAITAVDAPLWRLVGLGVVAIAVFVASLRLRLQAPLLISGIVVLVHAIGTFAPGIVAVYQAVEWWLWLAIGGVIVLVISIRFESSRRGVKAVIGRIAALR